MGPRRHGRFLYSRHSSASPARCTSSHRRAHTERVGSDPVGRYGRCLGPSRAATQLTLSRNPLRRVFHWPGQPRYIICASAACPSAFAAIPAPRSTSLPPRSAIDSNTAVQVTAHAHLELLAQHRHRPVPPDRGLSMRTSRRFPREVRCRLFHDGKLHLGLGQFSTQSGQLHLLGAQLRTARATKSTLSLRQETCSACA